jgi:hypothetical protein
MKRSRTAFLPYTDATDTVLSGTPANKGNYRNSRLRLSLAVNGYNKGALSQKCRILRHLPEMADRIARTLPARLHPPKVMPRPTLVPVGARWAWRRRRNRNLYASSSSLFRPPSAAFPNPYTAGRAIDRQVAGGSDRRKRCESFAPPSPDSLRAAAAQLRRISSVQPS